MNAIAVAALIGASIVFDTGEAQAGLRDTSRAAGTGGAGTREDDVRSGSGGVPFIGQAYDTTPWYDATGATLMVDPTNQTGTFKKLLGDGTSPTIATGLSTSRIGTGYTLTVEGKDTAGTIVLTTGTGITVNVSLGVSMFVVTFGTAYAANPHGVVTSRNRRAADLAAAASGAYFIDPITTDFSLICSKDITFANSTTYKWSYVVIG